ncbi:MAG: hypothetical protein HQ518_04005 [Rhodopirellula sp.]|nr:hypothetical protein [Rhodopirellula sp.]
MPAWRLSEDTLTVHEFDVGAIDGPDSTFVAHVVLCRTENKQTVSAAESVVETAEMGPPLGEASQGIHALGTTLLDPDGLPPDKRRQIKVFVDDRMKEAKAQQELRERLSEPVRKALMLREYVILPAYESYTEEVTRWRFSCAGFVLRAYEEARIKLLDPSIPDVTLDELKKAYPDWADDLDRQKIRERLGIEGDGPWPVVLPGYVMNSLKRTSAEIESTPYRPQRGDEYFTDGSPVSLTEAVPSPAKGKGRKPVSPREPGGESMSVDGAE